MIKKPKKRILVSFSGGETSAYMLKHILEEYSADHDIKVVFANTGEENEETLVFVQRVSEFFNIPITWIEYDGHLKLKIVDFETAYRSHDPEEIENKWTNHPFRKYIQDYGIPNRMFPSCSRDLKARSISRFMSKIEWAPSTYTKAIGIRADEIDRIGSEWYPLVQMGITKPMINRYWDSMPFRLQLKGYQGNCKTCWKKGIRKLVTLYRENPYQFAFFKQMELEFERYIPLHRKESVLEKLKITEDQIQLRFFRENRSVDDIAFMSIDPRIENAKDDSIQTEYQLSLWNGIELDSSNGCEESCEAE